MKYKLHFKALDTRLSLTDLSDEFFLNIIKSLWNRKYKREFDRERSFVETEYHYSINADGTFSYAFWIGDMYFTKSDYNSWAQDILFDFQQELNAELKAKGLPNVLVSTYGVYPDGAGYHGSGFVKYEIKSIPLHYPHHQRILDFYIANKKVTDYGSNDSVFSIDYREGNNEYRVLIGLIAKTVTKVDTTSVSQKPALLDKEELKFFDNLGFELNYSHKQATKQNIDDWFNEV